MFHMSGRYKSLPGRSCEENVPLNASSVSHQHYELTHVLQDKTQDEHGEKQQNAMMSETYHRTCPSSLPTSTALVVARVEPPPVFRDTNAHAVVPMRTRSRDNEDEDENSPPPLDGDPTLSESFDDDDDNKDEDEDDNREPITNPNTIVLTDVLNQCTTLKQQNCLLVEKLQQAEETIRRMATQIQLLHQTQQPQGPKKVVQAQTKRHLPFQVSSSPHKAMQIPGLTTASFDTFDSVSTNGQRAWAAKEEPHFQVIRKQESWGMPGNNVSNPERSIRPSSDDSVSTLSRTGTFDTVDMSLGSAFYHGGNGEGVQVAVSSSSSYHTAPEHKGQVSAVIRRPIGNQSRSTPSAGSMNANAPSRDKRSPSTLAPQALPGHAGVANNPLFLDSTNRCGSTSISNIAKMQIKSKGKKASLNLKSKNAGMTEIRKKEAFKKGGLKSIFKGKNKSCVIKGSTACSAASTIRDDCTEVAGNTIEHNLSRSYDECESLAEF